MIYVVALLEFVKAVISAILWKQVLRVYCILNIMFWFLINLFWLLFFTIVFSNLAKFSTPENIVILPCWLVINSYLFSPVEEGDSQSVHVTKPLSMLKSPQKSANQISCIRFLTQKAIRNLLQIIPYCDIAIKLKYEIPIVNVKWKRRNRTVWFDQASCL